VAAGGSAPDGAWPPHAAASQPIVSRAQSEADWDAYVATHPDATFSHCWRWRNIFGDVFRQDTEYLVAHRDGAISGLLPLVKFRSAIFGRFVVSLPYVNDGGLLTSDPASAAALLEEARAIGAAFGATHVELRHRGRLQPDLPCRQHKVGMLLPLTQGDGELWQALDRKVRNQVRKAQKASLTTVRGGVELVDEFYPVFARNMRDLGTPVYSKRLFERVLEEFPAEARLVLVRLGTVAVGGAVACTYKGTCEVPWASSLKEYRNLCPNMLMYWDAIETAVREGCHTFDFGRSTPDEGTYHFKRQWGAEPHVLHWEYLLSTGAVLPNQGPSNPKFRLAVEGWKRMPLPLASWLGPRIVRSIP
jgi:FemAB-related protein (PEP-CTERM system-associated)